MNKEKLLNKENKQVLEKTVKETRILNEYYLEDREIFKQEIQIKYSKIIVEQY